jgi:peptidoglycan/xylan/chitin deacetylase (PgdA/CDA1 family)
VVKVFITIDTEAWPLAETPEKLVRADFDRDYYGLTSAGEFGAVYQAECLRRHQLRGVFFVEALSSYISGLDPLRKLVSQILDRQHEVGLHVHTEWCRRDSTLAGPYAGDLMRNYTECDQSELIRKGLEQLHAAGAEDVRSFRAGGYGADLKTLKALARNGIRFDSSHNHAWLGITCDVQTSAPLWQPALMDQVYEYPVTCFEDWPGHVRHAEICACSSSELEFMLLQAHEKNWHSVVIVSHSFELIRRDGAAARPIPVIVRRFERLCRFLAEHRDRFVTSTFHDAGLDRLPATDFPEPLAGRLTNTMWRQVEQAWKRIA